MTCQDAQDLVLEADRSDLLGDPSTELGQHVASCAACGAVARRILDADVALDRALSQRPRPARVRRWMPATTWGALAAAAAVILLLLPRFGPPKGPMPSGGQYSAAAALVDVSSSAGQTAVVLRTADPGITVVWYFQN